MIRLIMLMALSFSVNADVIRTCVNIEYQRDNGEQYSCNDAQGDIIYAIENPDNNDAKILAEIAKSDIKRYCNG